MHAEVLCTHCGSPKTRASEQRKARDWVLWLGGARARRCRVCGTRFYYPRPWAKLERLRPHGRARERLREAWRWACLLAALTATVVALVWMADYLGRSG